MRWEKWSGTAKKPATQMITGLILIGLCVITDCENAIMHAAVGLFTAGLIGLTNQHNQQSNNRLLY